MRVGHSQWERDKRRKCTIGGQKIAYGLILAAFLTYSVALYKVARISSSSSSSSSDNARDIQRDFMEPGSLMDVDDWAEQASVQVDCSYSNTDTQIGGCMQDISESAYMCQFHDVLVDVSKMQLGGEGGETLGSVMGQGEEKEFVQAYGNGAFVIPAAESMPISVSNIESRQFQPLLEKALESFVRRTDKSCSSLLHVNVPTLFVVRHGYVNLRHTLLDLFNAHIALSQYTPTMSTTAAVNVVFLDSHPQGAFDSLWSTFFKGSVKYISSYKYQPTCFEHIIFPSPWYISPFQSNTNGLSCKSQPELLGSFLSKLYESYNIDGANVMYNPHRVVIINRHPYISHPRANSTSIPRQVTNFDALKSQLLSKLPNLEVILARPETLDFAQQIALFQSTSILIGTSGSGLMNTLFMPEFYYNVDSSYKSVSNLVIELDPATQSYDQYSYLSSWKQPKPDDQTHLGSNIMPASFVHVQLNTQVGPGNSGSLDDPSIKKIVDIVSKKFECENVKHVAFTTDKSWDEYGDKVKCQ